MSQILNPTSPQRDVCYKRIKPDRQDWTRFWTWVRKEEFSDEVGFPVRWRWSLERLRKSKGENIWNKVVHTVLSALHSIVKTTTTTAIFVFVSSSLICVLWSSFLNFLTANRNWRQNFSMYILLVKLIHVLTNASMGMYKIRVLTDIFEYYHQFHARIIMPRNNELKDREYFGNKWWSRTKNNKILLLVENLICV